MTDTYTSPNAADGATIDVTVRAKRTEADDICSLELVQSNGDDLPRFDAGAHVDVHLDGLVRQYSLYGDPCDSAVYRIGVLREPASRGGSLAIHDRLAVGDRLRISAPRNHFALDAAAPHTLLLGGGIGITPLMSMARQLQRDKRTYALHYATRARGRAAFLADLESAEYAGQFHLHLDDGAPEQRFGAMQLLAAQPAGTHVYTCGPTGFIDAVLDAARRLGWAGERVHREYFAAAEAGPRENVAFEVEIASTGSVYTVAADRTAVATLADHGIYIAVGCDQGICGTCLTGVLAGTPDHRDVVMDDAQHAVNDQFTPCCSRARGGRLVLDL